ncbi:adhesion G-protein coupled receptor D1-like [Hydractinia symbiolongicarpus]|uniref:adhesion G-protein coupled receptor D1-like n=1 Tax=Hydractinia symbiolongicarpus TaxID=13093 RepID=UPI00254FFB6A|nr:adhesion G-protein coupled receptor D1-like [Hydractinia symbiolongicarpus]
MRCCNSLITERTKFKKDLFNAMLKLYINCALHLSLVLLTYLPGSNELTTSSPPTNVLTLTNFSAPYNSTTNETVCSSGCLNGTPTQPAPSQRDSRDKEILLFQLRLEYIMRSVSYMFVCVSVIVLMTLRLPKSLKFFVHKQLLIAYLLSDTMVLFIHDDIRYRIIKYKGMCISMVIIYHYLATSFYACMLVEGLHIFTMLRSVFNTASKWRSYILYSMIGWGLPLLTTSITVAVKYTEYANTPNCYSVQDKWLWKGPIAVMLGLNVFLFILIISIVAKQVFRSRNRKGGIDKVLSTFRSMVIIMPLLGITFILGFFIEVNPHVMGYIFVISNGTLGFWFFVFHVVFDQQVRQAFCKEILGRKEFVTTTKTFNTHTSLQSSPKFMDRSIRKVSNESGASVTPKHGVHSSTVHPAQHLMAVVNPTFAVEEKVDSTTIDSSEPSKDIDIEEPPKDDTDMLYSYTI